MAPSTLCADSIGPSASGMMAFPPLVRVEIQQSSTMAGDCSFKFRDGGKDASGFRDQPGSSPLRLLSPHW